MNRPADASPALNQRLDRISATFSIEAFTRRAIATAMHSAWIADMGREDADRRERMDTMMSEWDYELARRYVLSREQMLTVRRVLEELPVNIRADLDTQQYRLRSDVYRHLGAEHRRRVAEVRCWVIDAIECIDELDFVEARRLIVDAEHSLQVLMDARPMNDRPSRSRFEFDRALRERTAKVVAALRNDALVLRGVSP